MPVLEGLIQNPRRPALRANLSLMSRLGLRRLATVARRPWISMPVVNPVGHGLQRNAAAETFTKAGSSVIRYFDTARDHVVFGEPQYRGLQFKPRFCQYMEGFKFVYLFPK